MRQVRLTEIDGVAPPAWPEARPVGLEALLSDDVVALPERFEAEGGTPLP
jgi:hypothetical protein